MKLTLNGKQVEIKKFTLGNFGEASDYIKGFSSDDPSVPDRSKFANLAAFIALVTGWPIDEAKEIPLDEATVAFDEILILNGMRKRSEAKDDSPNEDSLTQPTTSPTSQAEPGSQPSLPSSSDGPGTKS